MKAWVFQDHRQRKRLGDACPWSVGWIDPEGRRKSKRVGSRSLAEKFARRVEGQLASGTYEAASAATWKQFRQEYDAKVFGNMSAGNRECVKAAMKHFEAIAKPVKVSSIKATTLDDYVSKRCVCRGRKGDDRVSPATINKELRHLRAILRVAHDWGYLPKMPRVHMLREPRKLPRYVTAEHFAAIYSGCDAAELPEGGNYQAADWWRALLAMCYMTGWRIGEVLALRRDDLDLAAGVAITRAADNKGRRDERVKLHAVVVEHLKRLGGFTPLVFYFPFPRRRLWDEFAKIQAATGIKLPCQSKHEHNANCQTYGFHDLRRAFATMNAPKLSADALQSLMRHNSYQTTQRYIAMSHQLDAAVESLTVPDVLAAATRVAH